MLTRSEELRELLAQPTEAIRKQAGERLVVCETLDALHERMADDILTEIRTNNAAARPTRLILPVGPTGHYPRLAQRIADTGTSLADCWFFFMDEYATAEGVALDPGHPLSFQRVAWRTFLGQLPPSCGLRPERVLFPTHNTVATLAAKIDEVGGIDTCYGGVGIHGHVAFNEPEPGVRESSVRLVRLNDFTVTINAIRAEVGGDLVNFPRYAFTLGMREIIAARRVRLYCRNGGPYDWANAVLRLALLGQAGDDYPVTHLRDHPDFVMTTDCATLRTPTYVL